jgi:hypothetical protein
MTTRQLVAFVSCFLLLGAVAHYLIFGDLLPTSWHLFF